MTPPRDKAGALGLPPPMAPLRVMTLIQTMAASKTGLTLTELAHAVDIPKSSLVNLLRALTEGGFIESEGKLYYLGREMFRINSMIGRSDRFPANCHHLLERLRRESGETALVGIASPPLDYFVYVDFVESDNSLRFTPNLGERRLMHRAAAGKVILAFSTPHENERFRQRLELEPPDEKGFRLKAFEDELRRIRAEGFAISSASVPGVTGMMAPVFGKDSSVRAAVGISGPADRMAQNRTNYLAQVLRTAKDMSERQGYCPG